MFTKKHGEDYKFRDIWKLKAGHSKKASIDDTRWTQYLFYVIFC